MDRNKYAIGIIIPIYNTDKSNSIILEKCLDSIFHNCFNKNNIKVLLGLHKEDTKAISYVKSVLDGKYYDPQVKLFYLPASEKKISNFYIWGASLCQCDFFWCLQEGVEILTKHYDVLFREEIRLFKNRISQDMINTFIPYVLVGDENYPIMHTRMSDFIKTSGEYENDIFLSYKDLKYQGKDYIIDLSKSILIRNGS